MLETCRIKDFSQQNNFTWGEGEGQADNNQPKSLIQTENNLHNLKEK